MGKSCPVFFLQQRPLPFYRCQEYFVQYCAPVRQNQLDGIDAPVQINVAVTIPAKIEMVAKVLFSLDPEPSGCAFRGGCATNESPDSILIHRSGDVMISANESRAVCKRIDQMAGHRRCPHQRQRGIGAPFVDRPHDDVNCPGLRQIADRRVIPRCKKRRPLAIENTRPRTRLIFRQRKSPARVAERRADRNARGERGRSLPNPARGCGRHRFRCSRRPS